jgi:ribonuclease HII
MRTLAEAFPGYGWETNVGYGTRDHRAGMAKLGITPHHRRSFAPVRLHLGLPLFPDPSMLPPIEDTEDGNHWD